MDADVVACRSYTHARRYPWVIGRIGGWQLPTQLTLAQLAVIGVLFLLLAETAGAWAHLPRMLNLLVETGIPAAGAWAVRNLRMEGRSPFRALAGLIILLGTPRLGTVHGRPFRDLRSSHVRQRVFVSTEATAAQ